MRTRICILALLCMFPGLVYGQGGLGSISGQILDPTIKVTQLSTKTVSNVVSNEQGLFMVPSLVASQYTLTISAPGFKEKTLAKIDLNSAQNLALGKITLELGAGPTTVVDVSAEAVTIATENAVRDSTIQARQVDQMPLQGRNWVTLLKVIPGSTPTSTQGIVGREAGYDGMADFRVNGKSGNTTQMNLDGGSNVDHGTDGKTTVSRGRPKKIQPALGTMTIASRESAPTYRPRFPLTWRSWMESGKSQSREVKSRMRGGLASASSSPRQWSQPQMQSPWH